MRCRMSKLVQRRSVVAPCIGERAGWRQVDLVVTWTIERPRATVADGNARHLQQIFGAGIGIPAMALDGLQFRRNTIDLGQVKDLERPQQRNDPLVEVRLSFVRIGVRGRGELTQAPEHDRRTALTAAY